MRRLLIAAVALVLALVPQMVAAQVAPPWRAAAGIAFVTPAAGYNPWGHVVAVSAGLSRRVWLRDAWSIMAEITAHRAVGEVGGDCVSITFSCTPAVFGHIAWAAGISPGIEYEWPIGPVQIAGRASAGAAIGRVDHLVDTYDAPFQFTTLTWGGAAGVRWHRLSVEVVGSRFANVRQLHPNIWSAQAGFRW